MGEFITVARFRDLPLAELAKSKLESEGIECFLSNAHLVSIDWLYSFALGGVKVQVRPEDAQQAMEILDKNMEADIPVEHEDYCERCNSSRITVVQTSPWAGISLLVFGFLFLGIPFFFVRKRYKCNDCGHVMELGRR